MKGQCVVRGCPASTLSVFVCVCRGYGGRSSLLGVHKREVDILHVMVKGGGCWGGGGAHRKCEQDTILLLFVVCGGS